MNAPYIAVGNRQNGVQLMLACSVCREPFLNLDGCKCDDAGNLTCSDCTGDVCALCRGFGAVDPFRVCPLCGKETP